MIPSYYLLAREQHLSAIGLQAFLVKKKSRLWGEPQAGGLEPRTGLEPVTYALRMRRSTN